VKTVAQNLQIGEKSLSEAEIGTTRLDAELLLAAALGRDRAWLLAHDDEALTAGQQKQFDTYVQRRAAHEPLAYIVDHKEFYGLEFAVDQSVLIPRVETEVMVEQILTHFVQRKTQSETKVGAIILDIGTGCGAIAIALAKNLPDAQVTATDISADALATGRRNAESHGVSSQIDFVRSDLFAEIDYGQRFDIIAANLPYVPRRIQERLAPDLGFEPDIALYGGEDGLDNYRRFFATVDQHLKPNSQIWCESDPWQHQVLKELAQEIGLKPIFEDYLIVGFGK